MLEIGSVIRSKAGHDSGLYFIVVELCEGYVMICDGKQRPMEKPKHKNIRHISVTNTKLNLDEVSTNKGLRRALMQINESATQ